MKFALLTALVKRLRPDAAPLGGLLIWMAIATLLRFHHLTLKPLWTDEMSTLVFGLGHSFRDVPLSEAIALDTLLAPLRYTPNTSPLNAAERLLDESNHPPLYFMLTHGWLYLWHAIRMGLATLTGAATVTSSTTPTHYVSVWDARSLSAVAGVAAVPAVYGLGWLAFRSRQTAWLAAAFMAVSPFGVYLAQDARHYTLAVLWIIGSLACLVVAVRHVWQFKPLPMVWVFAWIGVNGLGLATHYFFLLTLLAELEVLLGAIALRMRQSHLTRWPMGTGRIGLAIAGTAATGLVWLPFLLAIRRGDGLTRWIYDEGSGIWDWVAPMLQTLGSVVSMVYLLPVQNIKDWVALSSGLVLVIVTLWTAWLLLRYWLQSTRSSSSDANLALGGMAAFVALAIATLLLPTYGLGIGLAQVFRYHFVYFPAVLLILAVGLTPLWNAWNAASASGLAPPAQSFSESLDKPAQVRHWLSRPGRRFVWLLLLLGVIGSLTVASDFGYRKLHRPDWVVQEMAERSQVPVLVAISHQTHGQTGRLMAVAWEMRSPAYRHQFESVEFFLDPQPCSATSSQNCGSPSQSLRDTISHQAYPFDVWLINFEGNANLKPQGCTYRTTKRTDGYKFQQYQCRA